MNVLLCKPFKHHSPCNPVLTGCCISRSIPSPPPQQHPPQIQSSRAFPKLKASDGSSSSMFNLSMDLAAKLFANSLHPILTAAMAQMIAHSTAAFYASVPREHVIEVAPLSSVEHALC